MAWRGGGLLTAVAALPGLNRDDFPGDWLADVDERRKTPIWHHHTSAYWSTCTSFLAEVVFLCRDFIFRDSSRFAEVLTRRVKRLGLLPA